MEVVALVGLGGQREVVALDPETGTILYTFADTSPGLGALTFIGGLGASEVRDEPILSRTQACGGDGYLEHGSVAAGAPYHEGCDHLCVREGVNDRHVTPAGQGLGSGGDFIVSAQAKEQALVFHRWGRAQPVFKVRLS
jgi:hypothetical protein